MPAAPTPITGGWRLLVAGNLVDWLETNDNDIAEGLFRALTQHDNQPMKASKLLQLSIPSDTELCKQWDEVVSTFKTTDHVAVMRQAIHKLDRIVGSCFGLSNADLDFVHRELDDDPFLKRILPRYPGTQTRKLGFLEGLERSDRYE